MSNTVDQPGTCCIVGGGPAGMMLGYGDPEQNAAAHDAEGFFLTGDIGQRTPDNAILITDRKKDIIITAGGKNITPSLIENELKFSPFVSDAVVIGDQRKSFTAKCRGQCGLAPAGLAGKGHRLAVFDLIDEEVDNGQLVLRVDLDTHVPALAKAGKFNPDQFS